MDTPRQHAFSRVEVFLRNMCSPRSIGTPLWLLIAAAGLLSAWRSPVLATPQQGAEFGLREERDEAARRLVVQNKFWSLVIRPDSGARISSLRFGPDFETELTSWYAGGSSGLLQEDRTADLRFELVRKEASDDVLTLELLGRSGDYAVRKRFEFYRESRWFKVSVTFENRSRFALSGREAPRVFSLMLPAADTAGGRQLYCMDRGGGVEVMCPELFLRRFAPCRQPGGGQGTLRWVAVTDPATRRGLGIAFLDAGARRAEAVITGKGQVGLRWYYPDLPPGSSLTSEALLVPLEGTTALSALNAAFLAETDVERASEKGMEVAVRLMALPAALHDVSVMTRVYDEHGKELGACDTVLFETVGEGEFGEGRTVWQGKADSPLWLLHEVYSEGKEIGQFAVPTGDVKCRFPLEPSPLPEPRSERLADAGYAPPGSSIAATEGAEKRGFVLWLLDAEPAHEELKGLRLSLAENEKEAVFLGLKALRPLEKVRVALGASSAGPSGAAPIPPAGAFLWRIAESPPEPGRMSPISATSLTEGQVMWLALTVDAAALRAGQFASRLVVNADGQTSEVPVRVEVTSQRVPAAGGFGLWFVADEANAALLGPSRLARLQEYGVTALTFPMSDRTGSEALSDLFWGARRAGFDALGFSESGRGVTARTRRRLAAASRCLMLASERFSWLLCTDGHGNDEVTRLLEYGFEPARIVQMLPGPARQSNADVVLCDHLLVADGVAPGKVPALLARNRIRPDAHVWLYLDVRGVDWRRAAARLRSAAWAAAWQGLSGLAVRCGLPSGEADRQSTLWHILRDAREDAALWRAAQQRAQRLENASFDKKDLLTRRVVALEEFRTILGAEGEPLLMVARQKHPSRAVLRVLDPHTGRPPPTARFWQAKERVLKVMAQADELLPARWQNLYWHGIPLLADGEVRWAIVSGPDQQEWRRSVRLQQAIESRTGQAVKVGREFPTTSEGTAARLKLIWAFGKPDQIENLPQQVRDAAARKGDQEPVVVSIQDLVVVLCPGPVPGLDSIAGAFRPDKWVYSCADSVR